MSIIDQVEELQERLEEAQTLAGVLLDILEGTMLRLGASHTDIWLALQANGRDTHEYNSSDIGEVSRKLARLVK